MMNLFLIPFLFFFYDCCFFLGLIVYLPFYFYRRKITFRVLLEKFAFFTLAETAQSRIWIHVVSVGEAMLIAPLVTRLRELYDNPIVISTTTLTGNKIARNKYSSFAQVIFFPFDFSFIVVRALRLIRPELFIAVETEIWPNLFYQLKCRRIPIVIVNGRISDKAFRRYRLLGPIIEQVLKNCSYVGVQSHLYRDRFLALGCPSEKITVSGNLKFESIIPDPEKLCGIQKRYVPLLKPEGNLVVVAASTHYPEEEIALEILRDTLDFGNPYTLVIAPRHTTRVPAIEESIRRFGFSPVRISSPEANFSVGGGKSVYILDTLGELLYFYSIADVCFVGGSLADCGGHNILEPLYFLKPTCFGPHMENFRDVEEVVLARGAGIRVNDATEFKEVLLRLVNDVSLRENLRLKALSVFNEERRGLQKNIEMIVEAIKNHAIARPVKPHCACKI